MFKYFLGEKCIDSQPYYYYYLFLLFILFLFNVFNLKFDSLLLKKIQIIFSYHSLLF